MLGTGGRSLVDRLRQNDNESVSCTSRGCQLRRLRHSYYHQHHRRCHHTVLSGDSTVRFVYATEFEPLRSRAASRPRFRRNRPGISLMRPVPWIYNYENVPEFSVSVRFNRFWLSFTPKREQPTLRHVTMT